MIKFISSIKILLACAIFSSALIASAQNYQTNKDLKDTGFKWPEGKQMAISLTFDDARLSQVDKGIPVLDKYNIKGTFYITPSNVLQHVDAWKKAAINGHEIGNHSVQHPCTGNFDWSRDKALENYTLEEMGAELDSANKFITQTIGTDAVSFAFPCGQTFVGSGLNLKSYVPLVAAMFETGRGWLDEGPNNPSYCDFAQLTGIELDGKTFDQVKAIIESARKTGKWVVFAGHEMNDEGKQTTLLSTLDQLCKYAADPANGIWIDNVHNIASYVRSKRKVSPFTVVPIYKNPAFSIKERTEDLLSRMTLGEKIGQMNMPCAYVDNLGKDIKSKQEGVKKFTAGTLEKGLGPGGGFFTVPNNILQQGPRQQAEFHNELQKIADSTRLGIPLLMTEEGTHGYMASGATIFPEGLGIGSTWNMDLVQKIYTVAAQEARSAGIHQIFTLVVEPNRDPRMGRNEEGYSEDPYLCSRIAENIVRGAQGNNVSAPDKVVAGLCHFPGQSQPTGGLEWGEMQISDRMLREMFLPPWFAGIKKNGALGVMATYPAIDGVPVHASEKILTDILRDEMGFEGLVLSEGEGFATLVNEHVAADQKEAGAISLKAGVDVDITYEPAYMQPLIENVKEGKVDMAYVDRAVKRILTQKFRLGLFENPYVDPDKAMAVSHTKEHQDLALKVAQEGIVLLKNEKDLLPLRKNIKSIAVIGPNADEKMNQLGDYTSRAVLQEIITPLKGIQNYVLPQTKVTYVKGCNVLGNKIDEISKAKAAAKGSDVAIVIVGENDRRGVNGLPGTDGEGHDVSSLDLTGMQEDLIKAVYNTGTPTIVVLINGRPLSIRWVSENVPAIIEAWNCGEKGGEALAQILFGDVNPSGRLSITVPRSVGQLPAYYNYAPSKASRSGMQYVDSKISPLYEFGFGLSYTTFEYSNLVIDPQSNSAGGEFHVSLDVKNTGKHDGADVVQLYIHDVVSSVVRPVKELKGFSKVFLKAGETKKAEFTITPEELSFLNQDLHRVVEPGKFTIMIGRSSEDIKLKGEIEVK